MPTREKKPKKTEIKETEVARWGNTPINLTAYRNLSFLMAILDTPNLTLSELNDRYLDNELIGRIFTTETIRKYINTLNQAGYNIHYNGKIQNIQFNLLHSPIGYKMTRETLRALQAVLGALYVQPIKHHYNELCQLFQTLRPFLHFEHKDLILSEYWAKDTLQNSWLGERISELEQLCFQGQRIEVHYAPSQSEEALLLALEPKELRYQAGQILLIATDVSSRRTVSLPIEHVTVLRQLPHPANTQAIQMVITFKLTGRVARNYRIRSNETVLQQADGLLVRHKTDEPQPLLWRLMKYGSDCELLTPLGIRDQMQQLITEHIALLKTDNPHDESILKSFGLVVKK